MDYEKIEESKLYRIQYKDTPERNNRQIAGLLPKKGTIVKVVKKDDPVLRNPIRIISISEKPKRYTCHWTDLQRLKYKRKNLK
jgi:hypothetical protein